MRWISMENKLITRLPAATTPPGASDVVEHASFTGCLPHDHWYLQDGEEPGPDTELEYWRTRMSNFNSITEQLKTRECKLVLGICAAGKTKAYARWKSLDIQVRAWMLWHVVTTLVAGPAVMYSSMQVAGLGMRASSLMHAAPVVESTCR
jgi:hypothetical protein